MGIGMTLGAIDAGSNAIRVSVGKVLGPGEISPLVSERVPVRLGYRTFTHGELDGATVEAAVLAFARFRRLFDQQGVDRYRAVATSAVRNASNREHLLDRLHRELDIELEVIDGEEEARLVRLAVLSALQDKYDPTIICDLGGGSLEVTESLGNEQWATSSMRIGTVRMMETFGVVGAISDDEAVLIRRYVAHMVRTLTLGNTPASSDEIKTAVACGGNAEALAGIFGYTSKRGVPSLKLAALEQGLEPLLALDVPGRMETYDFRQDRSEVVGIAALIFAELGKQLGLKKLRVPGVGLREGLLLDLATDTGIGKASPREPAVLGSARAFAARIGHTSAHGEQVRRLSRQLFDQLADLHQLPKRLGLVLEVAALLHDIGEVVHRRSHHKHGEYMILNGRIPGLSSPEREMVAALVRAHRKSPPDSKKHAAYAQLDQDRQTQVRLLAAMLRTADVLDCDHLQSIIDLTADIKSKKVVLTCSVAPDGSAPAASTFDTLKTGLFETELDRALVVEVVTAKAGRPRRATRSE